MERGPTPAFPERFIVSAWLSAEAIARCFLEYYGKTNALSALAGAAKAYAEGLRQFRTNESLHVAMTPAIWAAAERQVTVHARARVWLRLYFRSLDLMQEIRDFECETAAARLAGEAELKATVARAVEIEARDTKEILTAQAKGFVPELCRLKTDGTPLYGADFQHRMNWA